MAQSNIDDGSGTASVLPEYDAEPSVFFSSVKVCAGTNWKVTTSEAEPVDASAAKSPLPPEYVKSYSGAATSHEHSMRGAS